MLELQLIRDSVRLTKAEERAQVSHRFQVLSLAANINITRTAQACKVVRGVYETDASRTTRHINLCYDRGAGPSDSRNLKAFDTWFEECKAHLKRGEPSTSAGTISDNRLVEAMLTVCACFLALLLLLTSPL